MKTLAQKREIFQKLFEALIVGYVLTGLTKEKTRALKASVHRQAIATYYKELPQKEINELRPFFSTQNSKLRKQNIIAWDLPAFKSLTGATICPWAGECSKYCYAQCGTFLFTPKLVCSEENFLVSKQKTFVDLAVKRISELVKEKGSKIVRLHASGDFYSQAYLNKWTEIIEQCAILFPELRFYAYTKSLKLNWKRILKCKNFKRIQSEGGKADQLIDYRKPHAVIFSTREELDEEGYVNCENDDELASSPKVKKIGLVVHGSKKAKFKPQQKELIKIKSA